MAWNTDDLKVRTAVPHGEEQVRIVKAFDATAESSGNEMTTVSFEILEGAHKGSRLWAHFVRENPGGQRMMMALLAAVGLGDKKVVENQDLIGKELRVRVRSDEFEGQPQARIVRFLPLKERALAKK